MTPTEFRAALVRLEYSQRGFAAHVGANERTVRRWIDGTQDIPPWVPVMLGLMEREKVLTVMLEEMADALVEERISRRVTDEG